MREYGAGVQGSGIIGKMAGKSKPKRTSSGSPGASPSLPRPWSEFLGIALLAVGVLVLGGLWSYQAGDGTLMGPVGHLVAGALYAAFGMAAYLVALGVVAMGIKALRGQGMEVGLGEGVGFAVATAAGCVLLHVMFPGYRVHGFTAGGLAGELIGEVSLGMFHHAGTYLVATTVMCLGLLASTPLSSAHLLGASRWVASRSRRAVAYLWGGAVELVKTQRDAAIAAEDELAQTADGDEEDWETEGEWDYADGEEEEEEDEEEGEDEEDEGEEDEDGEELEAAPKKSRRKASASQSKGKAKATAANVKNKKRGAADAAPEEIDVAEALGEELSTESRKKKGKAKAAKGDDEAPEEEVEEPEIVVGTVDDAPKSAKTDDKKESGKKAPPRPEQLSVAQAQAKAAAANANAAANAPAKPARQRMPGVIRLTDGDFQLPPLRLFESAEKVETEFDRKFVLEQAQRLVTALGEFRIKGKVTKIHPGPVITRYEFKPEPGTKLSRIESLENDIAMALEAIRIRILAPIPGKATVGFEVPNKTRETVYIKEILDDEAFGNGKKLPLALGQDITGKTRVADMAKAPHLLVAGATGSGKSVGVNSMICSLLYTCSPEDVRMIMIDPKMLELSIYEGIPHLLLPVVTDPEKAALALRWAVQEMERRYALLSEAQVRDIAGYNKKLPELTRMWEADVAAAKRIAEEAAADAVADGEDGADAAHLPGVRFDADGTPIYDTIGGEDLPDKPTKLPYIVVIIDEFADLMMVASKEVEQCVARIAAKARAAGIHLIVATQRPSVDVITGTIKNNFPSRIAFQVTSDADSRTILDRKGAKQLLGMGDMLYMYRGQEVARVHGCFVSEDEILEVVKFIKRQAKPVYNMEIVKKQDDDGTEERPENMDPLYDRAVEIVAEAQKVSTSMLQRRLGVGYNRAAKIVEAMEEQGVIGPSRGTTPREVYVSAA